MKLNADVGESFGVWSMGDDTALMPHIDMANVACGGHASDPLTMRATVRLAKQCGVIVGAHPSYPDLLGFGRRPLSMPHSEAALHMISQVGALQAIASAEGVQVEYVKPHGALYNCMMDDRRLMAELMTMLAQSQFDIPLMILGTADHEEHAELAAEIGVKLLLRPLLIGDIPLKDGFNRGQLMARSIRNHSKYWIKLSVLLAMGRLSRVMARLSEYRSMRCVFMAIMKNQSIRLRIFGNSF